MFDISQETCLEAWRSGAQKLLQNNGKTFHLLTEISRPCAIDPQWLVDYSPHQVRSGANNIRDVVDTIFPITLRNRISVRHDMYRSYLVRHRRAMRWNGNRGRWGTYFERLIAFGDNAGPNQLEQAISKLSTWPQRNTTGLVFHLSSPVTDRPRTRGGPCWHFGEILWQANNIIDLAVVYRNHDFFNKALGNFIGLGQLLKFIAEESGKTPGKLICHSMHAFTDTKTDLQKLANI